MLNLDELMTQLEKLGKLRIQIAAVGTYPNKYGTKVQDVAFYQNDGTNRIAPARFVQIAEANNNFWETEIDRAVNAFLEGDTSQIYRLGERMALDINHDVNRVKTGRLKTSMRSEIKEK